MVDMIWLISCLSIHTCDSISGRHCCSRASLEEGVCWNTNSGIGGGGRSSIASSSFCAICITKGCSDRSYRRSDSWFSRYSARSSFSTNSAAFVRTHRTIRSHSLFRRCSRAMPRDRPSADRHAEMDGGRWDEMKPSVACRLSAACRLSDDAPGADADTEVELIDDPSTLPRRARPVNIRDPTCRAAGEPVTRETFLRPLPMVGVECDPVDEASDIRVVGTS
mmetsp:Transcript_30816/g.77347  ORF Transcript_30816/g.77347 Transcript_30816/m.77347 type:complete len:222 (+) Transcript_30816:933-1598(+)